MKILRFAFSMKACVSVGRWAALAMGLVFCALVLGACAGDPVEPDRTAMLPEDQRVSSVPWNKPQGWENQSQLGALANDPRIGGGSQSNSQRY